MTHWLLDTQLPLWSALEPRRLSAAARRTIEDRSTRLYFSFASLWEVAIKASLRRSNFVIDPVELHEQLVAHGFAPLELRLPHVAAVAELPWHHRDPFDRLLIAQAKAEHLTLLTADKALAAYGKTVKVA